MKIHPKMKEMLDGQIGMEGYASSYYLSMASWCESAGYEGAARFYYAQSDEERQHMLTIVRHLNKIGATAKIPKTEQPPGTFESLEDTFKKSLGSEQAVTASFVKMVESAQENRDYGTFAFLQWFVTEQVEEETKFEAILQKFDLIGRDRLALIEIDKILGGMADSEAAA